MFYNLQNTNILIYDLLLWCILCPHVLFSQARSHMDIFHYFNNFYNTKITINIMISNVVITIITLSLLSHSPKEYCSILYNKCFKQQQQYNEMLLQCLYRATQSGETVVFCYGGLLLGMCFL